MVRLHARQGRHLRAALHLEDAHGVGLPQHRVDLRVVRGQVGEVDLDPGPAQEGEGVLEGRHHPEAEEVHLDDPEVGAVLLVPLDDHAVGHARGLEGHHLVEAPLGHHHPPRVLAEVPRQVLDLLEEPGEEGDAPVPAVEPGALEAPLQRVVGVDVLEAPHVLGEPVDLVHRDAEHLADLARGAAVAVGDDVRGHGRPRRPVALVDVLDDPLAPVPAREVEVDVRPLPALLGEEALEEELHPHRVDRGDAEAVADRAVRGRAPALDEDPLPPAEVHEVPDDEEVAGEVQLADEGELPLDLPPRLLVVRPVALARPRLRGLAEEGELRLPLRHGVVREAVAEVLEGERQPLGERLGVAEEIGPVGEERGHRLRRLEVALGVLGQEAPRGGERPLLADAGQHVEERPALRRGVAHAVRGDRAQAQRVGQVEEGLVRGLLLPPAVPLHVEEDAAGPESLDDAGQPVGVSAGRPPRRSPPRPASPPPAGRRAPRRAPPASPRRSRPSPFGTPAFIRVISRQRLR